MRFSTTTVTIQCIDLNCGWSFDPDPFCYFSTSSLQEEWRKGSNGDGEDEALDPKVVPSDRIYEWVYWLLRSKKLPHKSPMGCRLNFIHQRFTSTFSYISCSFIGKTFKISSTDLQQTSTVYCHY